MHDQPDGKGDIGTALGGDHLCKNCLGLVKCTAGTTATGVLGGAAISLGGGESLLAVGTVVLGVLTRLYLYILLT